MISIVFSIIFVLYAKLYKLYKNSIIELVITIFLFNLFFLLSLIVVIDSNEYIIQRKIDFRKNQTNAFFENSAELMHKIRKLFHDNRFLLISNGKHEQTYIKADLIN